MYEKGTTNEKKRGKPWGCREREREHILYQLMKKH